MSRQDSDSPVAPAAGQQEVLGDAEHDEALIQPAIAISELTKTFTLDSGQRVTALDNLSLSVDRGELVCVVGPSGHGKSTLLSLIAGFTPPTSGTVTCHGRAVEGPGADRGVVFQSDTLFAWRRVRDNIAYGLQARHLPAPEREAIVADMLDAVGLTKFARAWPKELSGGMRRRVTLAAVFANKPEILLMDEPFSGLDDARRAALYRVLVDLWRGAGNTIVCVTHNVEEALALATRIVVMVRGRIVYDAPLAGEIPRDPRAAHSQATNQIRLKIVELLAAAIADGEL